MVIRPRLSGMIHLRLRDICLYRVRGKKDIYFVVEF